MDDLLTASEVQELLKIDRTTVYRMLKDGRLAGVKIGRQWRFPRRALDALLSGAPAAPPVVAANPPTLVASPPPRSDSLPLHCVQAIQDVFADLAGVGALTTAPDGTPLTAVSNGCRFCALVQSSPAGRAACRAEWANLAANSKAEPQVARCHTGLNYLFARIDVAGQPAAMLVAGQFRQAGQLIDLDSISARYGLDPQALAVTFAEVPQPDTASAIRISSGLQKVAHTFTVIAQERVAMIDRLRHIAALSAMDAAPVT
jgi:excisionase family DNA binding protein